MPEHLPYWLLFGALMAVALASIGMLLYTRIREAAVDGEAQTLANDLAKTAFTTLGRVQPPLSLPLTLAGSGYELEVDEERATFIVHIVSGTRAGKDYNASSTVKLQVENREFLPGGKVYFAKRGENVVISSSPIEVLLWEIEQPILPSPPDFYWFAKENAREAAAIVAGYFQALAIYPLADYENRPLDVISYKREDDNVLIQLAYRGGAMITGLRISGYENTSAVGWVNLAWVITDIATTDNLTDATPSPSVENAWRGGWVYSPQQVLTHLRGRTWRRVSDNVVAFVPADASIAGSAATTNVGDYPTWRVEWQIYVAHIQLMPWFYGDPDPGFVFQSSPELEPLI